MFRQQGRRFLFNVHAVGASAIFNKPHAEIMDAQATCSLSVHGGKAEARVEDFNHRHMVMFQRAYSLALGSYSPETGSWTSTVTSVVEGLSVLGVVTCDRMVARLASHHYVYPRESSFITLGSHFENLKVAGQLVHYEPDTEILKDWDTMSLAQEGCPQRRPYETSADRSRIHSSIVRKVACNGGVEVRDNVIRFPEFGSIHLGEIMIKDGERRLTMMRIEFGCDTDGSGNFGGVVGNGVPYP